MDAEDHVAVTVGKFGRDFVPASHFAWVSGSRKREPFGKAAPCFFDTATHGSRRMDPAIRVGFRWSATSDGVGYDRRFGQVAR